MSEASTQRIEDLLEQAVRWLRVLAAPTVRGWLEKALRSTEERLVYQASQGGSLQEVGKEAGVSHQTVANYWRKWAAQTPAIIQPTTMKGRYKRLYDLNEVDLPVEVSK